ncbi:MAG: DUF4101 domain-containing protein [Okeania sp. SIO3B5]|uniref:ARC6/PARC6 family protein n=1 Tax=Okeania sp. SIO3B5 TaxID=2607811 RepID=UPI00140105E4|nr:ARC6/PARC6 family protein [Okeania sp. SIO3B5]NEO54816.1 DUF4101 domain-containing protein [Okeania sp. SIO3B5]
MLKKAEKFYLSLKDFRVGYFLVFLFFGLCSCESLPDISQIINTTVTFNSTTKCPNKPPGSLTNPQVINIDGQTVQKIGTISSNDDIGFVFQGRQGQTLSYSYNEKLCVWIYTPDNKLLSGVELPINGTYAVHLASLKGTTTFEIEMKLSDSVPAPISQVPVPPVSNSNNFQPSSPYPIPQTYSSPSQSRSRVNLSQDEAVRLVNNWLSSKNRVFAHPFDTTPARRYLYTSGPLYTDITKPGGSVDWLRGNNSYYKYKTSRIASIISFSVSGAQPELTVSVYEDRTLYGPNGIDYRQSGTSTRSYSYSLIQENGNWKIFDYRKAN